MHHHTIHKQRKGRLKATLPALQATHLFASELQSAHKNYNLSCLAQQIGNHDMTNHFPCKILNLFPDGVILYDQAGKLIRMNALASRWFSGLADILASVQSTNLQGQALDLNTSVLGRLLHEEDCTRLENVEVLLHLPEERTMQVSVSGARIYNQQQQVYGVLLVWHDITERYRLEQRLQEAKRQVAQLEAILEAMPTSVTLVRGADARLVLANRATTTLWEAPWQEGQALEDFLKANDLKINPNEGAVPFAPWQVLREGKAVLQQQNTLYTIHQSDIPVLVNAVPFDLGPLYPDQETASSLENRAALVVMQDVSTLKASEQLKDEFLSLAAHELRTPLTVLSSYVQLLQKNLHKAENIPVKILEMFKPIESARQQLIELTKLMLDVTHVQAGRMEVFPQPVELLEVIEGIVVRLQTTTDRHQLFIHTTTEQVNISADPARLEQILTNLIGNAIKYSPAGGQVDVTIWQESSVEVLLSVRDQGIGIPKEQQPQLFERFVRGDNTKDITGTGLGLYLSRTLIEMQGGRIWFESAEGQGTTFYLAFPTRTA